jgi:hypothetical protein
MHSHQRHKSVGHGRARAEQFLAENAGGKIVRKKHGGSIRLKRATEPDREILAEGGAPKRRYARGGKAKHVTNIAVVIPHHKPALGAADAMGAMQGPSAPPMAPPGAGAPVPPSAGLPGRPAPFKRGGRTDRYGPSEAVPEDISSYRAAKASGGPAMTAGSMSGVGRLEKNHKKG